MTATLTLVSHALCPYVQRVAIVLAEKGLLAERLEIDLAHKPDWFLALSPTGKTPLLLADGQAIFESAAICEYLEDAYGPPLHPRAHLERARHRAWIEFASGTLAAIAGLYSAASGEALAAKAGELRARFASVELALAGATPAAPWFGGARLSLADAAFAPALRYFEVFGHLDGLDFLDAMPAVSRWREALRARPSVRDAVTPAYPGLLRAFLLAKKSALASLLASDEVY